MAEKTTQKFVTIDGRRLAIQDEGDGVPTVVLEMGLGAAASFYDDIARQLATFTRIVRYDRAALGHSDPAPTPRTIQDLVFDLHTLLHAAAIPGPYILAGHSMGGLTVRLYKDEPEIIIQAIKQIVMQVREEILLLHPQGKRAKNNP